MKTEDSEVKFKKTACGFALLTDNCLLKTDNGKLFTDNR
jgi:hypothetical protein